MSIDNTSPLTNGNPLLFDEVVVTGLSGPSDSSATTALDEDNEVGAFFQALSIAADAQDGVLRVSSATPTDTDAQSIFAPQLVVDDGLLFPSSATTDQDTDVNMNGQDVGQGSPTLEQDDLSAVLAGPQHESFEPTTAEAPVLSVPPWLSRWTADHDKRAITSLRFRVGNEGYYTSECVRVNGDAEDIHLLFLYRVCQIDIQLQVFRFYADTGFPFTNDDEKAHYHSFARASCLGMAHGRSRHREGVWRSYRLLLLRDR